MAKTRISELVIPITVESKGMMGGFGSFLKQGSAALAQFGLAVQGAQKAVELFRGAWDFMSAGIREQLPLIDAANKTARDLGLTFEELSGARIFADQSGVGNIEGMLQKANRRLGQFTAGMGGPAQKAMETLGISAEEIADLPLADQIETIAAAAERMGIEGQELAGVYGNIFGKTAAADAVRLFAVGKDGWEAMTAQAREMGEITSEQAAGVEAANDAWDMISQQISIIWRNISAAVAPALFAVARIAWDFLQALVNAGRVVAEHLGFEQTDNALFGIADSIRNEILPAAIDFVSVMVGGITEFLNIWNNFAKEWNGWAKSLEDNPIAANLMSAGLSSVLGTPGQVGTISTETIGAFDDIREGLHVVADELRGRDVDTAKEFAFAVGNILGGPALGNLGEEFGEQAAEDTAKPLAEAFPKALTRGSVAAAAQINKIENRENRKVAAAETTAANTGSIVPLITESFSAEFGRQLQALPIG